MVGEASAESGFAVRARPDGLTWVANAAAVMVPKHYDIPTMETDLATVTNGKADITFDNIAITPESDALRVDLALNLAASAHVDAGFTECNVWVYATPLAATARLAVTTGPDGKITANALSVDIDLSADTFELDVEGCVVGNLLENLLEAVEGWALDKVTGLVEDLAQDELLSRINDTIEQFTSLELDAAGFKLDARIQNVKLDPSSGLTVKADGAIEYTGTLPPDFVDTGLPPMLPAVGPGLPESYGPGGFALAASDDRVSYALYQAWRGGMFDSLLAGVAPTIELSSDGVAQKLGLPDGTTVDLGIAMGYSPRARFGRDGVGAEVVLKGLVVTADINAPGAPSSQLQVEIDGTLKADVRIEPGAGAVKLSVVDIDFDTLELTAANTFLDVDPARLRAFITAVVLPMLSDMLSNVAIAPALQPTDGVFVLARDITTDGGWLRVAMDMFIPDPNDHTAPTTELVDPRSIVSPALASFAVTGNDDTTPKELLRYVVKLDGAYVTETPAFMPAVKVSAADGPHVLEVHAVDLNNNEDRTPVVHSFYVDGIPPTLQFLDKASEVVSGGKAYYSWQVSDDRTALEQIETSWQLRKVVAGDAMGEVVAEQDFTTGRLDVHISDLEPNTSYVLQVVARDEAGNVTSVEHGFTSEPGGAGGCSATGGSSGAGFALLLALALLVAARRRQTKLVAVAAAAVAVFALHTGDAHAQGVGSTMSGPTDADGATAFWNPAAMARANGTLVELGSGVSLIRVGFEPMNSDTRSDTFVPKPEPTVGAITDALGKRWRLGFTVGMPEISGAAWSRDDGASDITRWYAVDAKTFHITITPSVSYQPHPSVSLGAGLEIVHSEFLAQVDKDFGKQLNQAAGSTVVDSPFPYADPTFAAPVDLSAKCWTMGAVAGVMIRPHDDLTIGASLHLATTTHATGTVSAKYPEAMIEILRNAAPAAELPNLAGKIAVDLEKPLMAFGAIAYTPHPLWEVRGDYRFANRSKNSDLFIRVTEAESPDVKDTTVLRGYTDRQSLGLRVSHVL